MVTPAPASGQSALLSRFKKHASPGSLSLVGGVQADPAQTPPAPPPPQIDPALAKQLSIKLPPDPVQPTSSPVSDSKKLDLVDQVMDEVEADSPKPPPAPTSPPDPSVLDSVVPQVTLQATDTLNPQAAVTTAKEKVEGQQVIEAPVDVGGSSQVELEKNPEMPVEVEQFMEHVEDHADQLAQEIVITGDDIAIQPSHRPTTPVVVLPITPEDEKEAKFKNPSWSIRWLVEWSHMIVKKFVGKVIYRRETD